MNYEQELRDMGVDEERIKVGKAYGVLADVYEAVMNECSEENFPVTDADRRAMGDDMLYPTYNIFGERED